MGLDEDSDEEERGKDGEERREAEQESLGPIRSDTHS